VKFPRISLEPSAGFILEDQARMSEAGNYFAWQSRMVLKELGERVVEVGCGIGNFTRMLLDREIVIALDVEARCVERLQARYPGRRNLHVFCRDASDAAFGELTRFQPDSFVCLNVLEHIADDRKALAAMAAMLPPEGVIVLLVPAFEALYGPLDHNLGHYRRYTRRSMLRMAESLGLAVKTAHYVNAAGFFGWWANAKIFHRQAQSRQQIVFFDRFVVPVISRIERLIHPPFGQSLFVVLRKPAA
jgi:2-polyprenyl-3-methyl-5-hydroxy-6-metoxy-1,4-benzoquinol methylase